ncbi:hypothetical protein [Paraburkholderia tuberum]|uniref:hypothetical protein n=1 Tax=Paraburkholderia TaxID=1822464 RepID=UPI00035FD31A|nr:hypothetical protein [Paraburkholderia tuberum]
MKSNRNIYIGLACCVIMTCWVFFGSTGLGYTEYRALRARDMFGLAIPWICVIIVLIRDRRKGII